MARLTVIADDLTGALDTGVQFANRCVSVRVAAVHGTAAVHEELFQADVAVIDAEVRHRSQQQAYKICLELVQQAQRCGTDSVYIKTDSGLRGNIGAMFQAALDASGAAVAYYAPALPQMNRLTRGGIQYIDGVPIDKSVFGQDPFEPVHSPYVKDLFRNCRAAIISCGPRALPPPPQHGLPVHCHGTAAYKWPENFGRLRRVCGSAAAFSGAGGWVNQPALHQRAALGTLR